ncbi:MAG: hypothetical protein LBK83_16580 [Treponema sp.]|jgi:hypothetical protein|nr:hypothetical protein [Treponema sp.]
MNRLAPKAGYKALNATNKKNLPGKGGKETREALNDTANRTNHACCQIKQPETSFRAHLHHQYTFKIAIKVPAVKDFEKLLPGYDFHLKITPRFKIYSCFAAGTEIFVPAPAASHILAAKTC